MILSANGKYEINRTTSGWTCTCPDHKYRHRDCKHIKVAQSQDAIPMNTESRYKPRVYFERTVEMIREMLDNVPFEICGSYRRDATRMKDIDVVCKCADLEQRVKHLGFITRSGQKLIAATINEIHVDFRIVDSMDTFWTTVMHFTGSKVENIRLRKKAMQQGLTLNEYGLFRGDVRLKTCNTERAIYTMLGETYRTPTCR